MKLSEEQIEKIAESIDVGFTYYVNPDTGAAEETLENDENCLVPDVDDEDFEAFLEDIPDWQKEMLIENKEQRERIDSWERCIIIEKPDSSEAYKFMEDFVEEIIPEAEQKMYWKALQWKSPFSNFNNLIHNSEYLDDWYEFKKKKLMEYVREVLIGFV